MPNLRDIARASEIGYKGRALFTWVACPDCNIARWLPLHNEITRCRKCAANKRERERKPVTFAGVGVPVIGDTATAATIGVAGRGIHVYAACPHCKDAIRWVRQRNSNSLCLSCAAKENGEQRCGENHPRWKGGFKNTRGYVYVPISITDPLATMATKRYRNQCVVAEHRLVIARSIGRPLRTDEIVHHINGIKDDNRLENLQLLNEHDHHSALVPQELQSRIQNLESRVTMLEAENVLLRIRLRSVRDSDSPSKPNLYRYNTLGNLSDKQIEGIVRASQ